MLCVANVGAPALSSTAAARGHSTSRFPRFAQRLVFVCLLLFLVRCYLHQWTVLCHLRLTRLSLDDS